MLRSVESSRWSCVAELGAGDGAITSALRSGIPHECRFLAVELSESLARELRSRMPDVEVCVEDAAKLGNVCERHGIRRLDAVFSGLPLGLLSRSALEGVLGGVGSVLRPGGLFAQVTYWPAMLPRGRHVRSEVVSRIGPLVSNALVTENTPPAWVFRCIRRASAGAGRRSDPLPHGAT
jgi:phospholipid N-methyltransferase